MQAKKKQKIAVVFPTSKFKAEGIDKDGDRILRLAVRRELVE